jgi:hypothetical protein
MLLVLCQGPLAARIKDGELFKLAAKFPMKRMEPGVAYKGPPFDLNEFYQATRTLRRLLSPTKS